MRQVLWVALLLTQTTVFSQDIIVTNYSGPTTFSRYEEFSPDLTVRNIGIVAINKNFNAAAYLSTDDQWDASDIPVESIYIPSLGAGQSFTDKPYRGRIDAAPGTYYLIIKGDHTARVTETDETNNLLIIPNFVITPPDVDFTFTSFSLDKATYTQNSLVKPTFMLQNLGLTDTGGIIEIQFALSTDDTFSQSDRVFRDESIILTGTDNSSSRPFLALPLPTVPNGTYYILARIDNNFFGTERFLETNESNNLFAIPITIQSSNNDLVITNSYGTTFNSSSVSANLSIRNNGTTGVAGYSVGVQLMPQGGAPGIFNSPCVYLDPVTSYIGPNEEKQFFLDFYSLTTSPPGTYYPAFTVNFDYTVSESNAFNNTYIDYSTPIVIAAPPNPGVTLNSLNLADIVDDTDQQINLNLNLTNSGNTTGFNQNYTIVVKNSQNTTVHSQQVNVAINFNQGQTVNRPVTLSLTSTLPVGSYQISISCTSSCYTTPTSKNLSFSVTPTQYKLTGSVKDEDGQAITNGKLFLYQDNGSGNVKFIQKVVPYSGPTFSFDIDTHAHTLYFIPDQVQYPDHVPTIYGKTLTLEPSNFFTPSADMNVVFEVLKIDSVGTGTGIINGYVTSGSPSAKSSFQPLTLSTAGIPMILISSSNKAIRITYTDESGFYEFKNLPRGSYQIMLSFELDNPGAMDPLNVDITDKNLNVSFEVSSTGVYSATSQLFLPQLISFNGFSTYRYGDPSIILDGQSSSGLPIQYSSSDNGIAAVVDGEIIIKGVGTVSITANQSGNAFYLPTSISRSLTIDKANQTLFLSPLAMRTFGDDPFTIGGTSSAGLPVILSSSDPTIASVSSNIVTIHRPGAVEIIAEQPGNDLYNAAPRVREWLNIDKASQYINLKPMPTKTYGDDAFPIEGTSSSGLAVRFSSSDPTIASVIDHTITIHRAGVVEITADQSGNDFYNSALPVRQWLTIGKAIQTISFDVLSEQLSDAAPFNLLASASSGLEISFESSDEEIASIVGNMVTIHKDGVVSITARQSGNQNYFAAENVTRELTINVVLGVEEFDLNHHIFPNPTTGFVSLQIHGLENVQVFDMIGRVQNDVKWLGDRIDFTQAEVGVYFVKLSFKNHSVVTRIFKK